MFFFPAFSISDVVTVNCEADHWGAAINITQLQMVHQQLNYSDIVLSDRTNCYGQVVGDLLLFGQRYNECGSKSEVCFHRNAEIYYRLFHFRYFKANSERTPIP